MVNKLITPVQAKKRPGIVEVLRIADNETEVVSEVQHQTAENVINEHEFKLHDRDKSKWDIEILDIPFKFSTDDFVLVKAEKENTKAVKKNDDKDEDR